MSMIDERYHEIGFQAFKNRFLREVTLYELVQMDENDVKKRIGHLAQEINISKEEVLEFAKRFMNEIYSMVKRVNDTTQRISFRK